MLEGVWRKCNPPTLLVKISTATVETNMEVPQKN